MSQAQVVWEKPPDASVSMPFLGYTEGHAEGDQAFHQECAPSDPDNEFWQGTFQRVYDDRQVSTDLREYDPSDFECYGHKTCTKCGEPLFR